MAAAVVKCRNDHCLIASAVGASIAIALFFMGYTFKAREHFDRPIIGIGHSLSPLTSLESKASDRPGGAQTTGSGDRFAVSELVDLP